jgi:propanol-preferring alcohol dehydrogenase
MKAMVLTELHDLATSSRPLEPAKIPVPTPADDQILIRISACGVCHTELDEIEGRAAPAMLPVVPGHQVVGIVTRAGGAARIFKIGERVGVAWIFSACGACSFCRNGLENLCPDFKATGRDANGGYAEYMVVSERFAYPISPVLSDLEAAPLLCAGAIGYRSLKLTGLRNHQTLGLTGFGASAHLVIKLAKYLYPNSTVFVFARSEAERSFAKDLGAAWAGDTDEVPPESPDAVIDTTPAWAPVFSALKHLKPGGRLVINAIRKETSDRHLLAGLSYETHLWREKEITTVANVARSDVREFLALAERIPLKPEVQVYPLEAANSALMELKQKKVRGAKVLRVLS